MSTHQAREALVCHDKLQADVPADLDANGNPKPVIDVKLPWSEFQKTILAEYVLEDPSTGHRIPKLEAALVSKYASMSSPYRARDKRRSKKMRSIFAAW